MPALTRPHPSLIVCLPASPYPAGILLQSEGSDPASGGGAAEEEGSVLHQACSLLECPPSELRAGIDGLLQDMVAAELRHGGAAAEGGAKRARAQAASAEATEQDGGAE